MADYTSDEIQEAVEKIVRSSVRKPYGILGNRDITTSFDDLQEAAAGMFALNPNAPYYVVFLGTERLSDELKDLETTTALLIEAVENLDRRVSPIDNLAPLNNARVALFGLETAAAGRTGSFVDVSDLSAFQRYQLNTSRFLEESSANIRRGGAVVPTPQESRKSIANLTRSLKTQRQELIDRSSLLSAAIEDYDGLELPSVLASGVSSRARQILDSRIKELEALSPEERLEIIRDVTLDILAGRAAVENVTSIGQTATFAQIEGEGRVFADATHPATAASLLSTIDGPWPIVVGADELYFTMDGVNALLVPLGGSFLATVRGTAPPTAAAPPDTYTITGGVNDDLEIRTGVSPILTVTLTAGSRTVEQIVADINAAITTEPIEAVVDFVALRFLGAADLDATGSPSDMDFINIGGTDWETLNVREGDEVRVKDPTSANDGAVYTVDVGGISGTTITCTQVSGPAPTDEVIISIEIGTTKVPAIRPAAGTERDHLVNRWVIEIPARTTNTAADTLGFQRGVFAHSRSSSAQEIADTINTSAPIAILSEPKIRADVSFVPTSSMLGRTDPDNATKLVLYRFRERANTTGGGPAGVVYAVAGASTAGVVFGDTLVIRETPTPADQDVTGTVTAVDDVSVTVTLTAAVSADTDVLIEIGPTIVLSGPYLDIEVSDAPGGQDGFYTMSPSGQGAIPFEFAVERPVPAARGDGAQPVLFNMAIGAFRMVFNSLDTTLATEVEVNDSAGTSPAAPEFFTSLPATALGTTVHYSIPEDPQTLSASGDVLEFYEANPGVISQSFPIVGLELSAFLIEVAGPGFATDQANIEMSLSATVPFARVRLGKKNNFVAFQEDIVEWLELGALQVVWERELDRLVSDISADKNPTATQINTLKLHLQELLAIVTIAGAISTAQDQDATLEAILASYSVSPEDDVDTLVETFLARGSVRGIDILLQGRFREFFGLSTEGLTYSGAVREGIREVSRLDLPIRKTDRSQRQEAEAQDGVFEDIDYDFNDSDLGGFEDLEIPGDFDETNFGGR